MAEQRVTDADVDRDCYQFFRRSPEDFLDELVSQAEHARNYNLQAFEDPGIVSGYVNEDYHRIRREEAAGLLGAALSRSDAPRGPVLEVAGGAESMLDEEALGREAIGSDGVFAAVAKGVANGVIPRGLQLDASRPWPLADESLAGVIAGEYLEHLRADGWRFLYEANRTLKHLGTLVLTVPNTATLHDRYRFLLGVDPRQITSDSDNKLFAHSGYFTASSLKGLLQSFGFEPQGLRSNLVGWQLPNGRWIESRLLARAFPSIGGSLVVSARKVSEPDFESPGGTLVKAVLDTGRI